MSRAKYVREPKYDAESMSRKEKIVNIEVKVVKEKHETKFER